MKIVTDLHLHSRYSRAVSPQMTIPVMAAVGKQKGIDLLTVSDWTHPLWFADIKKSLIEDTEGIYKIKDPLHGQETSRFLLTTEVSCIYIHNGKGRRVHNLLFAPSIEAVEKINKALFDRGYNLTSDARPILGISSHDLLELILNIDERSMIIPAHVWTPWFGVYGQKSGYESLSEAFGDLAPYVYGIETGLSSDPGMNWNMEELNTRSILSFSDAHSPAKMGRELTVFEVESLRYENIRQAIMAPSVGSSESIVHSKPKTSLSTDYELPTTSQVAYTLEFYPEEGKYHYSGHRNCHISLTPEEQEKAHNVCPVCGRPVTDGVMRRVAELGHQDITPRKMIQDVVWYEDPIGIHPPFAKLVPLLEIISKAIGASVSSKKTVAIYENLITSCGSELDILMTRTLSELTLYAPEKVVEGIDRVRKGELSIEPGYDGVYGTVNIWEEKEGTNQMSLLTEKDN